MRSAHGSDHLPGGRPPLAFSGTGTTVCRPVRGAHDNYGLVEPVCLPPVPCHVEYESHGADGKIQYQDNEHVQKRIFVPVIPDRYVELAVKESLDFGPGRFDKNQCGYEEQSAYAGRPPYGFYHCIRPFAPFDESLLRFCHMTTPLSFIIAYQSKRTVQDLRRPHSPSLPESVKPFYLSGIPALSLNPPSRINMKSMIAPIPSRPAVNSHKIPVPTLPT